MNTDPPPCTREIVGVFVDEPHPERGPGGIKGTTRYAAPTNKPRTVRNADCVAWPLPRGMLSSSPTTQTANPDVECRAVFRNIYRLLRFDIKCRATHWAEHCTFGIVGYPYRIHLAGGKSLCTISYHKQTYTFTGCVNLFVKVAFCRKLLYTASPTADCRNTDASTESALL